MRKSNYVRALRFGLSGQANAYGFTLVIWGTGGLAASQLGKPHPADIFAYIGGVLLSMGLAVTLAFGAWRPFEEEQPSRRPFSAIHLVSVPAATAAGWAVTLVLDGIAGFFLASFIAVAAYQLLLASEVAAAIVPEAARGSRRVGDENRAATEPEGGAEPGSSEPSGVSTTNVPDGER